MPLTTPCKPGDVVLVRFPFTDLSSTRQRPAVVVSPPAFWTRYCDAVVVAVTSQDPHDVTLSLQDWGAAGLLKPTWFKPLIATLSSSIIIQRLGTLTQQDQQRLAKVFDLLLDPSMRQ